MTAKRYAARRQVAFLDPRGLANRVVATTDGATMTTQPATAAMLVAGATGARATTRTVAASDATATVKALADYACDGVADEVQINAAIASLPAAGGLVRLSEGTFTLAAGVTLTGAKQVLRGMGMGATVLRVVDAGGAPVNVGIVALAGNYTEVSDLTVDGNKANNAAQTGMTLVSVTAVAMPAVSRVRMLNSAAYGLITTTSMLNGVIRDCLFEACANAGAYLRAVDAQPLVVSGCTAKGNTNQGFVCDAGAVTLSDSHALNNGAGGFQVSATAGVVLSGCTAQANTGLGFSILSPALRTLLTDCRAVSNTNYGFATTAAQTQFVACMASGTLAGGFTSLAGSTDTLYDGCTSVAPPNSWVGFRHASTGRSGYAHCRVVDAVNYGFYATAGTVAIRGCFVSGAVGSYGIYLDGGSGHLVDGCRVTNSGGHGIFVGPTTPDVAVTGNFVTDSGLASTNAYAHILVYGDNAFVHRNVLRDPATGNRTYAAIQAAAEADALYAPYNDTAGAGLTAEVAYGGTALHTNGTLLLDYTMTANGIAATIGAGAWNATDASQTFTVLNANSTVEFAVRGSILMGQTPAIAVYSARLSIDGTIFRALADQHAEANNAYQSPLGGLTTYKMVEGLAVGAHTVRVHIMSTQSTQVLLRAADFPTQEFLSIQVTEFPR